MMFSRLEAFYKKHGNSYVPPFQYEKLFDWTVNQRLSRRYLTKDQVNKLDSLNFDWENFSDDDLRWQDHYLDLLKFKQEFGHVRVSQEFKDKRLGDWVSKQRSAKTKGRLSQVRIQKLNKIGFLWKEDIARLREEAWNKRYEELVRYKKAHKHIDRIEVKHENYQLGLWMQTQIVSKDRLPLHRKRKLDAIGFRWDIGDIHEERWNAMYAKLKAYKAKHGHTRVKQSEDFKLSVWLQRNKRDKDKIGAEKRKKLEKLGVQWPYEYFKNVWETRYNELKTFKKTHGHLQVPKTNGTLFEWISTQKQFKKNGSLPPDRIQKLNKLGFNWTGEIEKQKMVLWERHYKKFKALKERYGRTFNIELKKDPALDKWVTRQHHSKKKLSAKKKRMLDAIGFPWKRGRGYHDELWEIVYQRLVAYKKKHGNCDVPQSYSKDKELARWVNMQRSKDLPEYRRNKLVKLGFSWRNEILPKRWLARLKEFTDAKKANRKIVVSSPLYSWLYQQRKNFKKLPSDKKKMLLKVGIV